jgi:hypothetical protein
MIRTGLGAERVGHWTQLCPSRRLDGAVVDPRRTDAPHGDRTTDAVRGRRCPIASRFGRDHAGVTAALAPGST